MKVIEDYTQNKQSIIGNLHYRQIPASFNGNILFYTLDKKFINGYKYQNGKITGTLSDLQKVTNIQQVASVKNTNKVAAYVCGMDDYYYWECTNGNCYIDPEAVYEANVYCTYDDGQEPPNAGGVTGDTGGGGGGTGGNGTPGGVPINAPPVDPCTQLPVVNRMNTNTTVSSNISSLSNKANMDSDQEWGFPINVSAVGGSNYLPSSVTPSGSGSTWSLPNFSWGGTGGYTVGFGHDHPAGNGPNYKDLIKISTLYDGYLQTAAPADQTFYQQNASMITTVPTGTYVIMIGDWAAYRNVIQTYVSNGQIDNDFQTYANQYRNNTTSNNIGPAAAAALLKMFGSSINVFYKANDDTDYKPINVQNGPQGLYGLSTKNCN